MRTRLTTLSVALCILGAACFGAAHENTPVSAKSYPYLLATCPVSGEKLGEMGSPVVKTIDGREVRFCCNACVAKFEADKATYWKKIDAEIVKEQSPHYPLKTCVVVPADELKSQAETKNGETCSTVDYVYNNRLVRFCCPDCIKKFNADPAAYMKTIDDAVIAQQKDKYPLDVCPISGEKLDDTAVNYVAGDTLVRFCCSSCVKKFEENPMPTMEKVHAAWMAKSAASDASHADLTAPHDDHHADHANHN